MHANAACTHFGVSAVVVVAWLQFRFRVQSDDHHHIITHPITTPRTHGDGKIQRENRVRPTTTQTVHGFIGCVARATRRNDDDTQHATCRQQRGDDCGAVPRVPPLYRLFPCALGHALTGFHSYRCAGKLVYFPFICSTFGWFSNQFWNAVYSGFF